MANRETLVLVEFDEGRPFSVITTDGRGFHYFDIDWCKRDGELYAHMSGFGASSVMVGSVEYPYDGVYWLADGYQFPVQPTAVRLPDLHPDYAGDNLYRYLDMDVSTVGCALCDDRFPDDDPCEHIWWCDRCDTFSDPGDRCGHNRHGNVAKAYNVFELLLAGEPSRV